MALPKETIHLGADPHCPDCGKKLEEKVCKSAAGYYIGTECCIGPYSRESHYYASYVRAVFALRHNLVYYRE